MGENLIKIVSYVIFCLFWTPIGHITWIAMLFRLGMTFTFVTLISSISQSGPRPNFNDKFKLAATYFVSGFIDSYNTLFKNAPKPREQISWKNVFRELSTVIVFALIYITLNFYLNNSNEKPKNFFPTSKVADTVKTFSKPNAIDSLQLTVKLDTPSFDNKRPNSDTIHKNKEQLKKIIEENNEVKNDFKFVSPKKEVKFIPPRNIYVPPPKKEVKFVRPRRIYVPPPIEE